VKCSHTPGCDEGLPARRAPAPGTLAVIEPAASYAHLGALPKLRSGGAQVGAGGGFVVGLAYVVGVNLPFA
jgi:hypothetical protein